MTQDAGLNYAAGVPVLIVADDVQAADAAREAVALTTGRAVGCVSWVEAAERLERQGALGVILAETAEVAVDTIGPILPRLLEAAQSGSWHIVVAFDEPQLDLVAGQMLGGGVQLLCAPSVAERVVALTLALAPRGSDRLHDAAREGEAARLRRLNEEVARIAETLARLSRDSGDGGTRSTNVSDRMVGYGAPPATDSAIVSPRDIRAAIRARRLRDRVIPGGLFEDPAWDMLLDLAAAELERAQVSVSSLCIAAAVAPTTALRWIGKLAEAGLVERRPDPFDRRRAFMALTERGRDAMRRYLATVQQEGLPIA